MLKLKVVQGEADIGVNNLDYSSLMFTVVDFTFPLRHSGVFWVTSINAHLPTYLNIFRNLDVATWAMLGASLLVIGLFLLLPFHVHGKGWLADFSLIIITPFSLLMAENLPSWFSDKRDTGVERRRNVRSMSGNLVLVLWCLIANIIVQGFNSNLRAIFIKQNPSRQVESAEDLYSSGKTIYIYGPYWYQNYLRTSKNLWHRLIDSKAVYFNTSYVVYENIIQELISTDKAAMLITKREIEGFFYDRSMKPKPLHFAREIINPTYAIWIIRKNSPWQEHLNTHLLLLAQVVHSC